MSLYTKIILCNNKHLFFYLVVIFLLPYVIKNAVVVYHVLVDYIFLIFAFSWSTSDEKRWKITYLKTANAVFPTLFKIGPKEICQTFKNLPFKRWNESAYHSGKILLWISF